MPDVSRPEDPVKRVERLALMPKEKGDIVGIRVVPTAGRRIG